MPVKIVINADDYGLSPGTNKAIEQCFKLGVLNSTSLIATGASFAEATRFLRNNPSLGIGAHLSLTVGKSVLPRERVPRLVDSDGYFKNNFFQVFFRSGFDKSFLQEAEVELKAQLELIKNSGLTVDHIDGQGHVHMVPSIFKIVSALAQAYNIPFVRISKDRFPGLLILIKHPPAFQNILKMLILSFLSKFTKLRPGVYGLNFVGILYSCRVSSEILADLVKNAVDRKELVELAVHPGSFVLGSGDFDYKRANLISFLSSKDRGKELAALRNLAINRKLLSSVKIVSFKDVLY